MNSMFALFFAFALAGCATTGLAERTFERTPSSTAAASPNDDAPATPALSPKKPTTQPVADRLLPRDSIH